MFYSLAHKCCGLMCTRSIENIAFKCGTTYVRVILGRKFETNQFTHQVEFDFKLFVDFDHFHFRHMIRFQFLLENVGQRPTQMKLRKMKILLNCFVISLRK